MDLQEINKLDIEIAKQSSVARYAAGELGTRRKKRIIVSTKPCGDLLRRVPSSRRPSPQGF